MGTMLTWHKVDQKVTMNSPRVWNPVKGAARGDEPEYGRVYSIASVCCIHNVIYFQLKEVRPVSLFDAASFVPVYPTIVDQLRKLEVPETVTEVEIEVVAS